MPSKLTVAAVAVVGCLLLSVGLASRGQTPSADDDVVLSALDANVKRFLDAVASGDTDGALRDLLTDSNLKDQSDGVRALSTKAASLESKYGAFRGLERIDARRVATDLVVMKYLYKCERFPVVWYFTYYRTFSGPANNDNWVIVTVRFDTELELLAL